MASKLKRAYYEFMYELTKAALEPVVAAFNDVLLEALSRSVRAGIRDAFRGDDD